VTDQPGWVDTAWWEVRSRALRDRHSAERDWVNAVALAWGLVRREDALTARELLAQIDMKDRLLGERFLTTTPLPGFTMDRDGVIMFTDPDAGTVRAGFRGLIDLPRASDD
jgi:hypothetical protein